MPTCVDLNVREVRANAGDMLRDAVSDMPFPLSREEYPIKQFQVAAAAMIPFVSAAVALLLTAPFGARSSAAKDQPQIIC
jgi:hypothetical protein